MKGYLKITAESDVREGMDAMAVDIQLSDVSVVDKMIILKNVFKVLGIDEKLMTFFLAAEKAGLLETESEDCKRDESEETCNCDCDKESEDKKPEIKVMTMDKDEFLNVLFGGNTK